MHRINKQKPIPISTALQRLLRDLGIEKKVERSRVIVDWPVFVGQRVADHSKPVRVEGEILLVQVSSDSWRNELVLMKHAILQKINTHYGKQLIKDIRFL